MFETGSFTPWDTRAFISAATPATTSPFNNYGRVHKQQYNAKIYQPLGTRGDFIALAGHYNQNRNNFFGRRRFAQDDLRNVRRRQRSRASPAATPTIRYRRSTTRARPSDFNYPPAAVDIPQAGVADASTPSTTSGRAPSRARTRSAMAATAPSSTGAQPVEHRQHPLVLALHAGAFTITVDPSYQYVKANGGGTSPAKRGCATSTRSAERDVPAPRASAPSTCVAAIWRLALLRPGHQRRRRRRSTRSPCSRRTRPKPIATA